MKKYDTETNTCATCFGYDNELLCTEWIKECGGDGLGCGAGGNKSTIDYYANKQECEHLLKLWDDANGSIAEWRDNEFIKKYKDGCSCSGCMGNKKGEDQCLSWKAEIKSSANTCHGECYAPKSQTEAILKWHDDRFGKIGDISVAESVKSIMTDLFSCLNDKKEKSVEDLDFRVGDEVFDLSDGNGQVEKIVYEKYALIVRYEDGDTDEFTMDGKKFDQDKLRSLYHGHNLKVTVEERKPVRFTTWMESVFRNPKTGECVIKKSGANYGFVVPGGWDLISGPTEVKIPK